MSFRDKSLHCSACGLPFVFSATEQEVFASQGRYKDPDRCGQCRAVRKTQRGGDGDLSYRSRSWK